jgi:CDGSH-type Zn-finger protein
MSEPVKITVRPNGPLLVEGAFALSDLNGKQWDLTGKPAVALCRCGAHKKIGFQSTPSPEPPA